MLTHLMAFTALGQGEELRMDSLPAWPNVIAIPEYRHTPSVDTAAILADS